MSFARTPSGLAAEHLFVQEIRVYVEGSSDRTFYEEVLQNYDCQVTPRNGREQCEKLAAALVQDNLPYVVVLDGDYGILERAHSKHRRVILLQRHSFENYLFEEEPIAQFCRDRMDSHELADYGFQEIIEKTERNFKELIILDVAHQRSKSGYQVLPDKPERFYETPQKIDFRNDEIEIYCTAATTHIDKQSLVDATTLVENFIRRRRLIDLLPGHFAFGIIRRLIIATVKRPITNEEIRLYLSRVVWGLVATPDHNSLKRRLRRAVREAQKMPRLGRGVSRAGVELSD